jgi:hypothetical protein
MGLFLVAFLFFEDAMSKFKSNGLVVWMMVKAMFDYLSSSEHLHQHEVVDHLDGGTLATADRMVEQDYYSYHSEEEEPRSNKNKQQYDPSTVSRTEFLRNMKHYKTWFDYYDQSRTYLILSTTRWNHVLQITNYQLIDLRHRLGRMAS